MRHRLLLSDVAIMFVLAFFLFVNWYYSPEGQEKIRAFVEQKIGDSAHGNVQIGSFEIGFFSITASNITMNLPKNGVDFSVKKIGIGLSLDALIHRRWKLHELVDQITIIKPSIVVTMQKPDSTQLKPAKLSVNEMIPFHMASITDASVTVKSTSGVELFKTKGLHGSVKRNGATADIAVVAAIGSLTRNVTAKFHLSDRSEDQSLTLKVRNLDLKQVIPVSKITINGKVNCSFSTKFREGSFPYNLIPTGNVMVSKLTIREKKQTYFSDGNLDLNIINGYFKSQEITGKIPGGEISSNLSMHLGTERISANGSIELILDGRQKPIKPLADVTGSVRANFEIPDLTKPNIPLKLFADLTAAKEQFTVNGSGAISGKGISLTRVTGVTKYGTVTGELSFLDGFAKASGIALISHQINSDYHISGTVPFAVSMKPKAKLPEISLTGTKLLLKMPQGTVPLPDLAVQTRGEALSIVGNNREISLNLTTDQFTDPLKSYRGTVTIFNNGVQRGLTLAGKSNLLTTGNVTVDFSGKNSVTDFHGSISAETKSEKLTIFSTGTLGGKKNHISIDQGTFSRGGYDFPFTALMNQVEDGWELEMAAVSGKFLAQGMVSPKFDTLRTFAANIERSELNQLNAFIPESDFPIRDGNVSASIFASGPTKAVHVDGYVDVDAFSIGGLDSIRTSLKIHWFGNRGTVEPFSITRLRQTLVTGDTAYFGDTSFANIDLVRFDIGKFLENQGGEPVSGTVEGNVKWDSSGIAIFARSPAVRRGQLLLDSIAAKATIKNDTLRLNSLTLRHLNTKASLELTVPLGDRKTDTLQFHLRANGDLLASAGQFKESPVGGNGEGSVILDGSVCNGEWKFSTARAIIPDGSMSVYPYVRGYVEHLYADMKLIRNDSVALNVRGKIGGREIVIKNDYVIGSLKPMVFGDINLGVIRLYTQEGGVPLFIPGFLENRKGNVGYIEVAGKDSIPAATLSGTPPDDFLATGTLLLRKAEITFPLLQDVEWPSDFDPFPMVGFDLDIQAADRSITYFYQIGDAKKRRALRLIEATIDPSYTIGVRGRYQDGDFRVTGGIRAYKGFLFYGKLFDQNFEMGLDFSSGKLKGEHDNLPVIWGSAESYSDTSRLNRSEVVIMTKDMKTGELVRRGRLTELVVVPASGVIDENSNIYEQSAEFYRNTGKDIMKLEGAGSTLSGIGDVYVNSFLFNYWGRRIARKLNFDLLRIETSVMSNTFNYLYDSQTDSAFQGKWTHLALANTGLTIGKYVANDQVMLKMRGQLSSVHDTTLVPEIKLGLEYQPLRYLWMDLNYGLKKDLESTGIVLNPEIRIQLRMPFSRLSSAFLKR